MGLKLSADQEKIVKAFSAEELEAFKALPSDERRIEMLEMIASTALATDVTGDFEEISGADEQEDVTILSAGGLGCQAGQVFVARFLGTVPMFSQDFKENWEEHVIEGRTVYMNSYYLFENAKTGKKFGLYKAPCLNKVLPKVPTKASNGNVAANPLVRITYVGKIKGKDVLRDKYDLVLTSGNEAHVHTVELERGIRFDRYRPGVVNYLKNPIPNLGAKEKLSTLDQAQRDWAQLEMVNGGEAQAAIGGSATPAQIEAH